MDFNAEAPSFAFASLPLPSKLVFFVPHLYASKDQTITASILTIICSALCLLYIVSCFCFSIRAGSGCMSTDNHMRIE